MVPLFSLCYKCLQVWLMSFGLVCLLELLYEIHAALRVVLPCYLLFTFNVWYFSGKMISKTLTPRRRLLWRLRLKLLEREPSSHWRLGWSSSRTCCWKEGSETCVCEEGQGRVKNLCVCVRRSRGRVRSFLWSMNGLGTRLQISKKHKSTVKFWFLCYWNDRVKTDNFPPPVFSPN